VTIEATDSLLPTDSIVSIDSIPALPWPQSVQAAIDTIIAKSRILHTTQMGLMVYDLTADSVLYEYNAKQTMRPA
jgi:D-alanyl-D-alanine carboxypeptidase/D-alanyl-D-alanine-endopeptidase (penicillin-binding protein 4)